MTGMIASPHLSTDAAVALQRDGFVVVLGPLALEQMASLSDAYDAAVTSAAPADVRVGSSTTRVSDFVNRGPAFDGLYVFAPLLEACERVIAQPFKLSTMHARTLRPHQPPQDLHVDFRRDAAGFPMIGFILMVDAFRPENGATRFVPGSHTWADVPDERVDDREADYEGQVLTCGSAGSLVIYNGSVWHGHTANASSEPRRSIQGAFIRRSEVSGANLPGRMTPETVARLSETARALIGI
jgi:hypothetical protein